MTVQSKRRYRSIMLWMLVPAGLLLFAGANAHLIYVAVDLAGLRQAL